MKQILALMLAVLMLVPALAACKQNTDETENEATITATPVKYSKSGKYTAAVSSENVDLSGITVENVEVRYMFSATLFDTAEGASPKDISDLSVKVESVKAADEKNCEIIFTDEKAGEYIPQGYIVLFNGIEGEKNTAVIEVEYPEITLTADVESVVSNATEAKVTLAIDGSTFEDGISEKDIYLDNAFSDMTIESVSSSEKNLTVLLKGTPVRNSAGAYQWGSVNVKPSGIKDGYATVTSRVDIQLAGAYIDPTTLKYESGRINADLKVYGAVDVDTLSKDNVKIDGATVEAAEKTDENTVKLTIAADGVKSANDFADTLGGKTMTLGDYETTVTVAQASIYPVFDYADADGDNLIITLKVYANSGTFDKTLKADAFSFADDFKDAKVNSVTVDSDTLATLILSVPAN